MTKRKFYHIPHCLYWFCDAGTDTTWAGCSLGPHGGDKTWDIRLLDPANVLNLILPNSGFHAQLAAKILQLLLGLVVTILSVVTNLPMENKRITPFQWIVS